MTYTVVIGDLNDNAPAVAAGQLLTISENSNIGNSLGFVTASDMDTVGALQSWQIVSDSSAGGFSIDANTGELRATRSFNYESVSSYSVTVRVNDGAQWSATRSVAISVLNVNEAPTAIGESFSIRTDQIVSVSAPGLLANDNDVDGNNLFPVLITGPANGTVSVSANGQFIYSPNPGFFGFDTVQYMVSDGSLTSNLVTVTIEVQVATMGNTGGGGSSSSVPVVTAALETRTITKTTTTTANQLIRVHKMVASHRQPWDCQAWRLVKMCPVK